MSLCLRLFIRLLSVMLVFSFGLEQIALAVPTTLASSVSQPMDRISIAEIIKDPSRLSIPHEQVTLKEIHKGNNGKLIIHIQDPHANYSGQMSVANTLDYFFNRYDLSLVFTEGSAKDSTLSELRKFAPPHDWRQSSKKFLAQGIIDGIEYLNLTTEHPMKILGMEYSDLYHENVKAYAELKVKRDQALNYLYRIKSSVQRVKNKLYPKEILDYEDRIRTSSTSHEITFEDKTKLLIQMSAGLGSRDYPELGKLKRVQEIEASIDFDKASNEQRELLRQLSDHESDRDAIEQVGAMLKTSKTHLSQTAALNQLFDLLDRKGLKPTEFAALSSYRRYLMEFSAVSMDALLHELDQMERDIYRERFSNPDLQKIRAIDEYIVYLEKAYKIQLSSGELEMLKVSYPEFPTVPWQAFLNSKLEELGYYEDLVHYDAVLDDSEPLVEYFYSIVQKRDKAFLANVDHRLGALDAKAGFLVAGGYHTENLTRLLKAQGYSYIVLTPSVLHETNHPRYEKLLLSSLESHRKNTLDLPAAATSMSTLETLAGVVPHQSQVLAHEVIAQIYMQPENIESDQMSGARGSVSEEEPDEQDQEGAAGVMADIKLLGSGDGPERDSARDRVIEHYLPYMRRYGEQRYYLARYFSEEIAGVYFNNYDVDDFVQHAIAAGIEEILKLGEIKRDASWLQWSIRDRIDKGIPRAFLSGWGVGREEMRDLLKNLLKAIRDPDEGLRERFDISRESVASFMDDAFPSYVLIAERIRNQSTSNYYSTPTDHQAVEQLAGKNQQWRDGLENLESKDQMLRGLKTLSYREREILKYRWGLGDDFVYQYEEIARIFMVGSERIKQIEAKAIRKLLQPSRSQKLIELLPDGGEDPIIGFVSFRGDALHVGDKILNKVSDMEYLISRGEHLVVARVLFSDDSHGEHRFDAGDEVVNVDYGGDSRIRSATVKRAGLGQVPPVEYPSYQGLQPSVPQKLINTLLTNSKVDGQIMMLLYGLGASKVYSYDEVSRIVGPAVDVVRNREDRVLASLDNTLRQQLLNFRERMMELRQQNSDNETKNTSQKPMLPINESLRSEGAVRQLTEAEEVDLLSWIENELSKQQFKILPHVLDGMSDAEISRSTKIALDLVLDQRKKLLRKMRVWFTLDELHRFGSQENILGYMRRLSGESSLERLIRHSQLDRIFEISHGDTDAIVRLILELYPNEFKQVDVEELVKRHFVDLATQIKRQPRRQFTVQQVVESVIHLAKQIGPEKSDRKRRVLKRLVRDLLYPLVDEKISAGEAMSIKYLGKDIELLTSNPLLRGMVDEILGDYQNAADLEIRGFRSNVAGIEQPLLLAQRHMIWQGIQHLQNPEIRSVIHASEPRTGKTISSVLSVYNAKNETGGYSVKRVLYTTKRSAMYEVKRELEQRTGDDLALQIIVIDSDRGDRETQIRAAIELGGNVVLVANYESVRDYPELVQQFEPDAHIIDEIDQLRHIKTLRAPIIFGISSPLRVAITAQPLVKKKEDVNELILWTRHPNMAERYGSDNYARAMLRRMNPDELFEELDINTIRWRRRVVLPEVPEPQEIPVAIPYNDFEEQVLRDMRYRFTPWRLSKARPDKAPQLVFEQPEKEPLSFHLGEDSIQLAGKKYKIYIEPDGEVIHLRSIQDGQHYSVQVRDLPNDISIDGETYSLRTTDHVFTRFIYEQAASLDLGLVLPETQLIFSSVDREPILLDVYENVVELGGETYKRSFSLDMQKARLQTLDGSQEITLDLNQPVIQMDIKGQTYTVETRHRDLMEESSKIKWLDELVGRESADNGKVLALIDFREAVKRLEERYSRRYGEGFGLGVWGGTILGHELTLQERNDRIWRFRSEANPKILTGTYGLLASSISLFQTPGSNHRNNVLVRLTRPWMNLFDTERLVGYGQTHQVRSYTAISEFQQPGIETIGQMAEQRLEEERTLFEHIIDGKPIVTDESQSELNTLAEQMMQNPRTEGARIAKKTSLLPPGNPFDGMLPDEMIASTGGRASSRYDRLFKANSAGSGLVPILTNNEGVRYAALLDLRHRPIRLHNGKDELGVALSALDRQSTVGAEEVVQGLDSWSFKSEIKSEVERMEKFIATQAGKTLRIAIVDSEELPPAFRELTETIRTRLSASDNLIIQTGSVDSIQAWMDSQVEAADREDLVVFGWHEVIERYFSDFGVLKASVGIPSTDVPLDQQYIDVAAMMHLLLAMATRDEPRIKSIYERLTGVRLSSTKDLLDGKLVIYPRLRRILVDLYRIGEMAREALISA